MNLFNTDALKPFIKWYDGRKWKGLNLRDYLDKRAKCGCGIDCCDEVIHLTDKSTGTHMVTYISNGDWVTESWADYQSTGADVLPICTNLSNIADAATGISPTTALTWAAATGAEGYKVSIGTSSGATDTENATDAGALTTITMGTTTNFEALAEGDEFFVTIIPYSDAGEKTGCTEISFTTLGSTTLTTPTDGATGITVDADVTWAAATGATGYKVTIGSATGLSDIANAVDVGALTTVTPGTTSGIPAQAGATQYFWTITAYSATAELAGAESDFTTA